MNLKIIFITLLFTFASLVFAENNNIRFNVIFNGDKIGTLTAVKKIAGTSEQIDVRTVTDAKILVMAVHVESELSLLKDNAVMKRCIVYRHSNRGSENISGYTQKQRGQYVVNINHKTDTIHREKITFCVADLYFKEPVAIKEIYSNMYGCFISVSEVSAHRYKVTMPDGKQNYFGYKNGQLDRMEVDLAVGKVISTRVY